MSMVPSPNGPNGRDAGGRFANGNAGGPGNPLGKRVAKLRAALLEAVTPADFKAVIRSMVKRAKAGDIAAIRELFDRTLGKPTEGIDLIERLDALEASLRTPAQNQEAA